MRAKVFLATAITVLCWAFAFAGIRVALRSFTPSDVAAIRLLVAAVLLLFLSALRRATLPTASSWARIALLALVGFVLYHLALNAGERTVEAGVASVLVNTVPVWTALFSALFLGERLSACGWGGLLASFAGVALIGVERGSGGNAAGFLLLLLAAILQAIYFVLQKPMLATMRPIDLTTWCIALAALAMLPAAVGLPASVAVASPRSLAAAVALGVLPTALACFTWSYVLARVPVARAASALYAVPVVTIFIAYGWLGETPSCRTLLGAALALGGVVVVHTLGRRATAAP